MKKNAFILALCMAFAIAPQSLTASAKSIGMPKPAPIFTPFFMNTTKNWQHQIYATVRFPLRPTLIPRNFPSGWLNTNKNRTLTPDFEIYAYGPIFSTNEFNSVPQIYPYFDYFIAWWPKLEFSEELAASGPVTNTYGHWNDDSDAITDWRPSIKVAKTFRLISPSFLMITDFTPISFGSFLRETMPAHETSLRIT